MINILAIHIMINALGGLDNMCSAYITRITFYEDIDDKAQLQSFRHQIEEALNTSNNLADVLSHFYTDNDLILGKCKLVEADHEHIEIEMITPFIPKIDVWSHVLRVTALTDINFVYTIENPVSEVFINTDLYRKYYNKGCACVMNMPIMIDRDIKPDYVWKSFGSSSELLQYLNDTIENYRDNLYADIVKQSDIKSAYSVLREYIHSKSQHCFIRLYFYDYAY